MNNNSFKILMDRDFSIAMQEILLNDKYATPAERSEEHMEYAIKAKKYKRNYTTKIQRKALEICLLYDKVTLFDCYEGVEIIDNSLLEFIDVQPINNIVNEYTDKEIDNLFNIKPIIIDSFTKSLCSFKNKNMKPIINKFADGLYDFLVYWDAKKYEEAVKYSHIPFESLFPECIDIVKAIKNGPEVLHADMIAGSFELDSISQLLKISDEKQITVASNRVKHKAVEEINTTHEIYSMFAIEMKEEFMYYPVVDSIDELLRLREKKEIIRLREQISFWKLLIQSGDIVLSEKIRADIKKANKELARVSKIQKANSMIFYISFFTDMLPVVSNIIGYSSKALTLYEEHKREKNEWLMIGF